MYFFKNQWVYDEWILYDVMAALLILARVWATQLIQDNDC